MAGFTEIVEILTGIGQRLSVEPQIYNAGFQLNTEMENIRYQKVNMTAIT